MAISKEKKQSLVQKYVQALQSASSAVVVQQAGVDVGTITQLRKQLALVGGKYIVVRKRLFLRSIKEVGFQDIGIGDLTGSVALLASGEDEFGSLKAVNNIAKKIEKTENWSFTFLGGWFDKDWKDGEYVTELADMPSRDELLSKLVYLLNYPVQSFAAVLNQVAEKIGDGEVVPVTVEAPLVVEESKTEEATTEEPKAE